MAFETLTLDEQHAILIAMAKVLLAGMNGGKGPDVSQGSFLWLFYKTLAAGVTDNHAHIAADQTDLLPDSSLGDILDRWRAIKGLPIKGATPASGSAALRINGTPATSVPALLQLTHTSGNAYQVMNADVIGPGGYVDVDVQAIGKGSATKLNKGEHLTVLAPPPGIDEDAILQKDLTDGGEDAEIDGAKRERVLDSFAKPALGGADNDYVTWVKEVTGVAQGYPYHRRAGVGTMDVVALHAGSGGDRLLELPEIADVQAYLDTKRPSGVLQARVLQVTSLKVDVDFTVVTDGDIAHAFDWDDTTPATVLAWTAGTRTVQVTGGALPVTLAAGDRISIKPLAGGGSGVQRVVEAITGVDTFILEQQDGADDPAAGDTLYAGGAIVEAVREAIIGLFDSLGPANPDNPGTVRPWLSARYGAWEGNLRPIAISRAATSVFGVIDGTVVAPAATVVAADPAFPDDATIQLLIPGRILVRAQH